MRPLERIPLAGAVALLAALVVAGVYSALRAGFLLGFYLALAGAVLFAGAFLHDYHRRPLAAPSRPATDTRERGLDESVPEVDESDRFVDPVIEADRIAAGEVLPDVVDEEPSPSGEAPVGP